MKRKILSLIFLLSTITYSAFSQTQWITSGTNMSSGLTGGVGIGTTTIGTSKLVLYNSTTTNNALRLDYGKFSMGGVSEFDIDAHGVVGGRLKILVNGNVGIGTNTPGTFKLAVNGKLGAREIVVTTAPFADFVFLKSYRLRPLEEVEEHINENGRLPEMPSAKEVEENGYDIGQMNALLLQKIEELTLYMIEMKKENEAMKKEIQELLITVQSGQ